MPPDVRFVTRILLTVFASLYILLSLLHNFSLKKNKKKKTLR